MFFSFFFPQKGGIWLCMWGFFCPICLAFQGIEYDEKMLYNLKNPMKYQIEQDPPCSCGGMRREQVLLGTLLCCCLSWLIFGSYRHEPLWRMKLNYYCCCGKCEDYFLGCCCLCCSEIQLTMARQEYIRLLREVRSSPVNIKSALKV